MATGLLKGEGGDYRPGDLAGLLKGLSGLLPGLDAAKLLQQQNPNAAQHASTGRFQNAFISSGRFRNI